MERGQEMHLEHSAELTVCPGGQRGQAGGDLSCHHPYVHVCTLLKLKRIWDGCASRAARATTSGSVACNLHLAQLSTNRTSVHSLKRCFRTDLIRPAQAPIWILLFLWLPFTWQTTAMDKNGFHLPQLQSGQKERMMYQPCQNPKLLTNTSGES